MSHSRVCCVCVFVRESSLGGQLGRIEQDNVAGCRRNPRVLQAALSPEGCTASTPPTNVGLWESDIYNITRSLQSLIDLYSVTANEHGKSIPLTHMARRLANRTRLAPPHIPRCLLQISADVLQHVGKALQKGDAAQVRRRSNQLVVVRRCNTARAQHRYIDDRIMTCSLCAREERGGGTMSFVPRENICFLYSILSPCVVNVVEPPNPFPSLFPPHCSLFTSIHSSYLFNRMRSSRWSRRRPTLKACSFRCASALSSSSTTPPPTSSRCESTSYDCSQVVKYYISTAGHYHCDPTWCATHGGRRSSLTYFSSRCCWARHRDCSFVHLHIINLTSSFPVQHSDDFADAKNELKIGRSDGGLAYGMWVNLPCKV